jgi:hypothetical protein
MGRSIVSSFTVALCFFVSASAIAQTSPPKDKIDKLLDDILKERTSPPKSSLPPATTKLPEAPIPGKGPPFTKAEIEAVREKVRPCWAGPSGQDRVVVPIVVRVREDGTPTASYVKDTARFESDPNYRAAANSALRAVMNPRCHPWPLPPEKYETWRIMTFNFDFGT